MPDDFDFFNDEPKAAPKPRPKAPARAEPVDDDFEDEPPRARPASRRTRDDRLDDPEPVGQPRYPARGAAPKKKLSPLLIGGIIAGAVLVLAGGVVGIVLAIGGGSKTTEPKDKGGSTTVTPPPKVVVPPKKDSGDPNTPSPDVVDKVKKASVYIRVAFKNGKGGTGSGFVEKDSRLVVTNAHVVGLLEEKDRGPKAIELVFNSGEGPDKEYRYGGELVAFDKEHDLAIIRPFLLDVGARQVVPEGLTVPKSPNLILLQKLFVFGYPLGEKLGTEITVTETSVSSLRKESSGKPPRIQVKGGMNPGNSGGPVVDVKGNVVGVAVSVILGTDINFAIPGEVVQEFIAKNRK